VFLKKQAETFSKVFSSTRPENTKTICAYTESTDEFNRPSRNIHLVTHKFAKEITFDSLKTGSFSQRPEIPRRVRTVYGKHTNVDIFKLSILKKPRCKFST
jgi:hypothetical protein